MKRYLLLAALGVAFFPLQFDVKNLVDKLTAYSLQFPQEKIFIHFDKPTYSTGETMWFKAYLVDAFSNAPVSISNIIHVELLSSDLKILDKKMLRIENGGTSGDFLLPDSISPGNYHVRAYTNWMQNFDDAFLFRQSFRVLKTQTEEEYVNPILKATLNFFPEGGDLVDGIPSIVAMKATDQFGRGLKLKGSLVGPTGSLSDLETDERGMGALIYTPQKGQKATAQFTFEGRVYEFDLPQSKADGYAFRVLNNYESPKITLTVTGNTPLAGSGLIAHHKGEVFYSVVNQSDENAFAVRLDRKDFPAGVSHITFFDPEGRPRAERLIYANYPIQNEIKLRKGSSYDTRSLVSLGLSVSDTANGIVPSNLSISITPRDLVNVDQAKSIVEYLHLTSDIVGKVEDPGYYMQLNESSFKSLDLLMMTQGWRRFKWEEVMQFDGEFAPDYWAEDGITFKGQVFDFYNRDLPRQSQISLSVLDGNLGFIQGETDELGRFFFSGNEFNDSTNLMFQAKRKLKKKGKTRNDVYITINETTSPILQGDFYQSPPVFRLKKQEDYLTEKLKIERANRAFNFDKDAILLDEVSVTGVKEIRNDPFESPFKIYDQPTSRVVADSVMRGVAMINIYDLLRRVPGVRIIGSFPNQGIQIGGPSSVNSGTQPLIILDGVNVGTDALNTIPPTMVSHVDVLDRAEAAIYGSQGANGVVAIYTKSGMGVKETGPKNMGILNHSHPGYSRVREFFTPNYAEPKAEHAKPDYRTTLYWNPTIITEGEGMSELEFYSSDQKGTFDILIQGITAEGVPVFARDSLKVE